MEVQSLPLQAKQAALLWLAGCKESFCFHRVYRFWRSSSMLSRKTLQCFLLNGLIFLGSLYVMKSGVIPVLSWILPDQFSHDVEAPRLYSSLRYVLVELFNVLWFYPLYTLSIIVSTLWYGDIAKDALSALEDLKPSREVSNITKTPTSQNGDPLERPAGFEGTIIGAGEQVYSLLLQSFFFLEVIATGYIPYIGTPINFLLLSWMYSYYCFQYKWNYCGMSFNKRINFFESNWPFFAGFGSPCVLAIFFFPALVSYGVMATLYPLFVLTAIAAQAEEVIASQRRSWRGDGLRRLSIFSAADALSLKVVRWLLQEDLSKLE